MADLRQAAAAPVEPAVQTQLRRMIGLAVLARKFPSSDPRCSPSTWATNLPVGIGRRAGLTCGACWSAASEPPPESICAPLSSTLGSMPKYQPTRPMMMMVPMPSPPAPPGTPPPRAAARCAIVLDIVLSRKSSSAHALILLRVYRAAFCCDVSVRSPPSIAINQVFPGIYCLVATIEQVTRFLPWRGIIRLSVVGPASPTRVA